MHKMVPLQKMYDALCQERRIRLGTSPIITPVREVLAGEFLFLVTPVTGLADRMFALSGFLALCEVLEKKPFVLWPINEQCNGKLSDVFALDFECEEFDAPGLYPRGVRKMPHMKKNANKVFEFDAGMGAAAIYQLLKGKLIPANMTCATFQKIAAEKMQFFRLKQDIQKTVDEFKLKNFQLCQPIGIHMRRTDKIKKWKLIGRPQNISAGWLKRIDRESFVLIKKHTMFDKHFFLACDSAEYAEMVSRFLLEHDCVPMIYPKKILRSSLRQTSLEDAVRDMYLLSKCKKIICCGPSGFPVIASQLGNVPIVSVRVAPRRLVWLDMLRRKIRLACYRTNLPIPSGLVKKI